MTKSELLKDVIAGKPLLVVEYRTVKTDVVRRNAPKTGQSATMPQAKHKILIGDNSYEVTDWLPDGTDLKAVVPLWERGTRCVLEVETIEHSEYGNRVNGKLHPLDMTK